MRIWHRLKTVLPLILAISMSANAAAQIFGTPGGGFQAFNGSAGTSNIGYPAMAPAFQSHPFISPFDNALEQHFSSDGLWYRDTMSHFERRATPYKYNFQLEYMRSKVRNFTEQVGDPNGPTIAQEQQNLLLLEQVLRYRMFFPPLMGQMSNPKPYGMKMTGMVESRDGWRAAMHVLWNADTAGEFSARADRDQYRRDEVDSLVFALTGGIGNPGAVFENQRNTSDLAIAIDLLELSPLEFDSLEIDTIDIGLRGTYVDVLNRTLISQMNLPLQNLTTLPAVPNEVDPPLLENFGDQTIGVYQRFDLEFSIRHNVETYGAGGQFETDVWFVRNDIPFRGLLGGRYMRINEGFHFFGMDSGLSYTVTNSEAQVDRIDNDGDFFVDDVDEGGTGSDYVIHNISDELLIRSFVDSQVESDLGGPEIGLSYDLGKKLGINITGSTRVGALLNNERLKLSGDNIGKFRPNFGSVNAADDTIDVNDTTEFAIDPITQELILTDLFDTSTSSGQPTQNAFSDTDGAMHVSPMFEQQLSASIPLFDRIPVLKDMNILEHSSLNVGWTFLWVGEVAAPHRSIVWESNPRAGLFPSYDVKRNDFYQHTFRLGINCEY